MKRKWLYVLLGFLCLTATGLYAQESTITGIVRDEEGKPLLRCLRSVKEHSRVDTDLDGKYP